MKKEEMIKIIDKLIDDEKEAIEGYQSAISKCVDSSHIVAMLSRLNEDEARHLGDLEGLKERVKNYDANAAKAAKLFSNDSCCGPVYDYAGIVLDEDTEE